ncbi:MAG TPA: cation:dicarboxylase symporter family transporter [Burkholderiaceae bacterium]
MSLALAFNLLAALAVVAVLATLARRDVKFSRRVFIGMAFGIALGAAYQAVYGVDAPILKQTAAWLDVLGTGYVKLLQMVIIPLIMVSIIGAILKLRNGASLGRISVLTLGLLIATTVVAAAIGITMARLYGLDASTMVAGAAETARGTYMLGNLEAAKALTLPSTILSFLPANPFLDMTGARKSSTIAVVVFSAFIAFAAIGVAEKQAHLFESFSRFVDVAHAVVMRMVAMVLKLTPYGVFALMAQLVAQASMQNIVNLIGFVAASYSALTLMFLVHLLLIAAVGLHPLRYASKIGPVLMFAFTSRSSAGAIPMSVQTQTRRLGTPEGVANFAASFGASIGQNGCAGIYPAMLAVMIAPSVGIDPMAPQFLLQLLGIVAIGSIGVAGVGGGATFAALIVLSAMNLPVALAGLLISIEPLIDMGRTALNVSGSITAGTVTSRVLGMTDRAVFDADDRASLDAPAA